MIRCGQMMLANAILQHLKRVIFNNTRATIASTSSALNLNGFSLDDVTEPEVYENLEKEVISKFLDSKSGNDSPFSIREVTDQGLQCFHKVAGDWYGTNSISQVLKELNQRYKPYDDFEICVFNDGVMFKSEVIKAGTEIYDPSIKDLFNQDSGSSGSNNSHEEDYFEQTRQGANQSGSAKDFKDMETQNKSQHSGGSIKRDKDDDSRLDMKGWSFENEDVFLHNDLRMRWNKCVLVIVNTRLGLKKIPEEAYSEITKMFKIPQMVGIIGGKGRFGLYFVGVQKDNLILLDPHFNQETVTNENDIILNRDTYR